MSIFESKKTKKYKEMAWGYQSMVEVTLDDFATILERVASGSMSKESAYDYLVYAGSRLSNKHYEFKEKYRDY